MMIPWGYLFSGILVLIIVGLICVILLENRNPHKALSWVLVLMLLPGLGVVLYLLFGRQQWHLKKIQKHTYDRFDLTDTPSSGTTVKALPPNEEPYRLLMEMVRYETSAQPLLADEVAIFRSGLDKVEALLEDIHNARQFIHLEYYIFLDDYTGKRIADALIKKAKEGVKVRVMCDYVGSFRARGGFFRRMTDAGIEFRQFLKVVMPSLRSDINYRNHRKVVVIDRMIGYIGGMNIADHYTVGNHKGCWHDTHFRVTGMAVNGLQSAFMSDWRFASKIALSQNYYLSPGQPLPPTTPNLSTAYQNAIKIAQVPMQTFASGPTNKFRTLLQAWSRTIYEAKKEIYIETPYFLPTDSLNKALIGAALSGVEVHLVLPWNSDSYLVKYASQSYYADLLEAGVQIHRFDGEFNHSKLLTVDGRIAYIGSANMDFRSLEYNFELTAIVYNTPFANALQSSIQQNIIEHCQLISPAQWQKRSLQHKLLQSFCRLFSPLL